MTPVLPNFFIIGAPKCGTTSLARWLSAHPQVFMSRIKEPHFFSTDLGNRKFDSECKYLQLFASATARHLAVGEASTWYLFSDAAVPAIESRLQGVRYIVLTRDPVEMARSLHHHNVRVLHEDKADLMEAWWLQEPRRRGDRIPATCTEPAFLQYLSACALGRQLERLYERVDPRRVLHLKLETLQSDPGAEYRRVLEFLGLDDDGRCDFQVANPARGYRSRNVQRFLRFSGKLRLKLGITRGLGLSRLNERRLEKTLPTFDFLQVLESAFAEERVRLNRFENR